MSGRFDSSVPEKLAELAACLLDEMYIYIPLLVSEKLSCSMLYAIREVQRQSAELAP